MSNQNNSIVQSTTTESQTTNAATLSQEIIEAYQRNGFVRVRGIISKKEAAEFRAAALDVASQGNNFSDRSVFTQTVNGWQKNQTIRKLTLHPNITAIATKLAGVPLRLWHDHVLIKQPNNHAPTHFHQDKPYWPHTDSPNPLSCWVALCDVPVERGCMTFIPGSHQRKDLESQNLEDSCDLFNKCPDLQWEKRVTIPLRAGDCTFHHGLCAHMANANSTDESRVATAIIYMDAAARYSGKKHVVTDPLNLTVGAALDGELFPAV